MKTYQRGGGVVFLSELPHESFRLVANGVGKSHGFPNVILVFFKVSVREKVSPYLVVISGIEVGQFLGVPVSGSLRGGSCTSATCFQVG